MPICHDCLGGLIGQRNGQLQLMTGSWVVTGFEPVFKVAGDATGLRLVLTHGRWQPGVLVIGDPDSWLHRRNVVELGH